MNETLNEIQIEQTLSEIDDTVYEQPYLVKDGCLYEEVKIKNKVIKTPTSLPYTSRKKDLSILKIESAHTKDTPRGSTARMRPEDSERTKSGQYAERNRQEL